MSSVTNERTSNHQRDVKTNLSKISEGILTNEMTVILVLKANLAIHQENNKSDGLDWYVPFFPSTS